MKRVRPWLPALLWAATIFALSSIPGRALPALPMWNADKLVHVAVYAVLGRAVLARRPGELRARHGAMARGSDRGSAHVSVRDRR